MQENAADKDVGEEVGFNTILARRYHMGLEVWSGRGFSIFRGIGLVLIFILHSGLDKRWSTATTKSTILPHSHAPAAYQANGTVCALNVFQ
jgi:hypothetical protein